MTDTIGIIVISIIVGCPVMFLLLVFVLSLCKAASREAPYEIVTDADGKPAIAVIINAPGGSIESPAALKSKLYKHQLREALQ